MQNAWEWGSVTLPLQTMATLQVSFSLTIYAIQLPGNYCWLTPPKWLNPHTNVCVFLMPAPKRWCTAYLQLLFRITVESITLFPFLDWLFFLNNQEPHPLLFQLLRATWPQKWVSSSPAACLCPRCLVCLKVPTFVPRDPWQHPPEVLQLMQPDSCWVCLTQLSVCFWSCLIPKAFSSWIRVYSWQINSSTRNPRHCVNTRAKQMQCSFPQSENSCLAHDWLCPDKH